MSELLRTEIFPTFFNATCLAVGGTGDPCHLHMAEQYTSRMFRALRVDSIIDRAIQRFLDADVDSLSTGYMVKSVEWGKMDNTPRQKIQGYFYDDGCVIINKAWVHEEGRWFGDARDAMVVDKHYNFEIDDEVDFWVVESIMLKLRERGVV